MEAGHFIILFMAFTRVWSRAMPVCYKLSIQQSEPRTWPWSYFVSCDSMLEHHSILLLLKRNWTHFMELIYYNRFFILFFLLTFVDLTALSGLLVVLAGRRAARHHHGRVQLPGVACSHEIQVRRCLDFKRCDSFSFSIPCFVPGYVLTFTLDVFQNIIGWADLEWLLYSHSLIQGFSSFCVFMLTKDCLKEKLKATFINTCKN